MNDMVITTLVSILLVIFTGFATYYFSTKNNKSLVYDILEKELPKLMDSHTKEKHYMDIASEIDKHEKDCGRVLEGTLANLRIVIHKMELRQNSMNIKLSFMSHMTSKIAEKLQIVISPNMIDTKGDEDE